VAKIMDFGLAVVLKEGAREQYLRQPQATRWCAPETVASGKLSPKSDMWSFGITFWELFAEGGSPWARIDKRAEVTANLTRLAGLAQENTECLNMSVEFPLTDAACPRVAYDVMLSCLAVDEDARPKASEMTESLHNFFREEFPPMEAFCSEGAGSSALAAASLDGSIGDADSCGASTQASAADSTHRVPKTLVRQLSSKFLDTEEHSDRPESAKFELLREFVFSSLAVEVLGLSHVNKMRQEIQEALQGSPAEGKSGICKYKKEVQSADEDSKSGDDAMISELAAPIRELLLPRVASVGNLRCWASAPPLSIWTLWSLVEDDALWRRDYVSKASALAAQEADGTNGAVVRQTIYSSNF